MHVRLLLVGFVFETIAIPVAVEPDLFASSSPDDLFALDNSLSSEGTDIAWADDQLIAGASPDLQWDSQDSDPLLGSTEPSLFDEELASSDPCDGLESSLDFDPLTARDLADSFPGLNELTEPVKDFLNDFQKTPQCSGSSPKAPPEKKIPTSQVPEDSSPDLFIITGLEPGQCPRGYPIPLYCDGFWVGLNVEDCTPYMQTFLMNALVMRSYCCQGYKPVARIGEVCVETSWGGNSQLYTPPGLTPIVVPRPQGGPRPQYYNDPTSFTLPNLKNPKSDPP